MRRRARAAAAFALVLAALPSGRALAGAEEGEVVYQKFCSQCHGVEGRADGPAAQFVLPRPRIFADNSTYKFRSTASGELPLDEDLHRVIWEGIPGTSMPAFSNVLSDAEAWDLVAFIKSLSEDFSDPDLTVSAIAVPELRGAEPLEANQASLLRGQEIYDENKCWQCHGAEGRGDGPSWAELTDEWGDVIIPTDLTGPENFRNGHAPIDLFRTISTGIGGTPMPQYADSISVEDRWHLINYMLSLGPAEPGRADEVVVAAPVESIPAVDDEETWSELPVARFPMAANVIEPPRLYWPSVEFVNVQAAYTELEVAVRVRWNDRSQSEGQDAEGSYGDRDGTIHHLTDHPDQLALVFPKKRDPKGKVRPYVMFGDTKRPVVAWWWRSDWGEMREIDAKGMGNLTPQDTEPELQAEIGWSEGQYTLLVRRTLASADGDRDVQFPKGAFTPVAFNVWDGSRGEVGQRRALTTWYWLYLQPSVPRGPLLAKAVSVGLATFLALCVIVALVRRKASRDDGEEPLPRAA